VVVSIFSTLFLCQTSFNGSEVSISSSSFIHTFLLSFLSFVLKWHNNSARVFR
jgi:hypothetical protein